MTTPLPASPFLGVYTSSEHTTVKAAPREIYVRYFSCDGATKMRRFKSLKGARKFAHDWIGAHPEIGSTYAISGDGVGKIVVEGATLAELFPS